MRHAFSAFATRRTENTLVDPDAVLTDPRVVRDRGFATDDVENE